MRLRLLLCCVCLVAWLPAHAVEIFRCEDRSGRQVFSDLPCRAIGALPLPSARDPASAVPPEPVDSPPEAEDDTLLTPPAAASGCPGPTPELLGEALAAAASRGDLNAIAGMYHWPAAGRGATNRVFAEAGRLSTAAPLSFEVTAAREDDRWLWAGQPPPDSPRLLPPELLLAAATSPDRPLARFQLVTHAGCFWLPP
jgi:hypothetical protein